jgi:hypothetical protein
MKFLRSIFNDFMNNKISLILILFSVFYCVLLFVTNKYVLTENVYYNLLSDRYEIDRIEQFVKFNDKVSWISYLTFPIFIFLKWLFIGGAIYTIYYLRDKPVSFGKCMRIVAFAEIAMLLALYVKLVYFLIHRVESFTMFQSYSSLSILNLISLSSIPTYLIYPFQLLNLFEVFYWLLLSYGLYFEWEDKFVNAIKVTFWSYGVLLIFWVVLSIFIKIQST